MFIWIEYGCDQIEKMLVNSDVTCDILLGHIKRSCVKEHEAFFTLKLANIQNDLQSMDVEMNKYINVNPEGDEEDADKSSALKALQEKKDELNSQLKNLNDGHELFEGLVDAQVDLGDLNGARKNINSNPKKRACEIIAPKETYLLLKIDPSTDKGQSLVYNIENSKK